jgi:pimeloyl-ACP methyl ester carboxylesterase
MLVRYDERGCGLSDPEPDNFSFEGWLRDLEAVVDTMKLERFALLGISQGGPVAIAYAAAHPERVSRLVLYGTYARGRSFRMTEAQREERQALITLTEHGWGRDDPTYRQLFTSGFIPGAGPEEQRWFNDLQRESATGENASRFMRVFDDIDVRELLPKLALPVLVMHARDDKRVPFEEGRRLAAGIAGAQFVPLEGRNHILLGDEPAWSAFVSEVNRFLAED